MPRPSAIYVPDEVADALRCMRPSSLRALHDDYRFAQGKRWRSLNITIGHNMMSAIYDIAVIEKGVDEMWLHRHY